jgi:hypothetical protein
MSPDMPASRWSTSKSLDSTKSSLSRQMEVPKPYGQVGSPNTSIYVTFVIPSGGSRMLPRAAKDGRHYTKCRSAVEAHFQEKSFRYDISPESQDGWIDFLFIPILPSIGLIIVVFVVVRFALVRSLRIYKHKTSSRRSI